MFLSALSTLLACVAVPFLMVQDEAPGEPSRRLDLPALPPVTASSPMDTILFADRDFAQQVETMFESDLALSYELPPFDLEAQSRWFQFKVRYANMFAQIL